MVWDYARLDADDDLELITSTAHQLLAGIESDLEDAKTDLRTKIRRRLVADLRAVLKAIAAAPEADVERATRYLYQDRTLELDEATEALADDLDLLIQTDATVPGVYGAYDSSGAPKWVAWDIDPTDTDERDGGRGVIEVDGRSVYTQWAGTRRGPV